MAPMELRRFGTTNLWVSPIGLGLAAIGRPGYINLGHAADLDGRRGPGPLAAHAATMLDSAFGAGVRYFDAARSYGRAEEFLARWLSARESATEDAVVGSKWGYTYTAEWKIEADVHEVKEHSLEALERQLSLSLSTLGDKLALYQIHSATSESGVLENEAVLDRLADLRDGGVAIGLSTSGPQQAESVYSAIDVARGGTPLFASVQATWNLLETSVAPALEAAAAAGMAVIVKEAVANGRLTERNRHLPAPLRDQGTAPDAIAIAAALAHPWATIVLSGAATIAQLESNLSALEVDVDTIVLPDIAEDPAVYWRTRSNLAWT
jgi:aryl-alcohol dehydrogenase-like predicted oxidoreductase